MTERELSLDEIINEGCIHVREGLRASWYRAGGDTSALYNVLMMYEYEELLNNYGSSIYREAENRLFSAFLDELSKISQELKGVQSQK